MNANTILILAAVAGGFYFLSKRQAQQTTTVPTVTIAAPPPQPAPSTGDQASGWEAVGMHAADATIDFLADLGNNWLSMPAEGG